MTAATTTRPLTRRQQTYRAHWQHVVEAACWECDRNLPCNIEDRLYQERRAAEVADDDESAA